jgi:hypothetical protein
MESSYKTALAIVGAILITLLLIVGVLCFYKNGCVVHFCGQQLRDSNNSFKKEKEIEEGEWLIYILRYQVRTSWTV